LFGFELWRVCFEVYLAAPDHVSVIFDLMRAAAFLTSGTMRFACESGMVPLPTIVTLRNS